MSTTNGPAARPERYWATTGRARAVSLAPLTARVLIVSVWLEDGEVHQESTPALAVEAQVVRLYRKRYAGAAVPCGRRLSLRQLRQQGWRPAGQDVRRTFVFQAAAGCLLTLAELDDEGHASQSYRAVVCAWPAEQDAERLAPIVAGLAEQLRARQATNQGR